MIVIIVVMVIRLIIPIIVVIVIRLIIPIIVVIVVRLIILIIVVIVIVIIEIIAVRQMMVIVVVIVATPSAGHRAAAARAQAACVHSRELHPVSITRFPLARFSSGSGLLRNRFCS